MQAKIADMYVALNSARAYVYAVAKACDAGRTTRFDAAGAILLASEIVTNAVLHSNSRCAGGTVTVMVIEIGGGLRVEVADNGSDLSTPVVKGDIYASDGHGLYLVQTLADQWGYVRDETGTTVWFWLRAAACR